MTPKRAFWDFLLHCFSRADPVGWVSDSVTHADVGFHPSTQPTVIFNLITPTYLERFS